MPEENPGTGVKDVTADSPSAVAQAEPVNPPAESNSVQEKSETTHVPYSRFKEVNDRMRSHEKSLADRDRELAELRKQLASHTEVPSGPRVGAFDMSKYSSKMAEKGLDPKVSDVLSEIMADIAKEESQAAIKADAESREKSARSQQEAMAKAQAEMKVWREDFKKGHPDFSEYEDDMRKEWESLDEGARMALVASPKSYELLYKVVKSNKLEVERQKGIEEGRKEAYEGKSLKAAVSSAPGATAQPGRKFTADDVGQMSLADYKANKDQILRDLGLRK